MANAIVKISKEAKRLQRIHKSWPWKDCIRVASDNYNAGKLGTVAKSKSFRQTGTSSKKHDEQRTARPPGARIPAGGKKVTYYERRKNRSDKPGSLTGVSASTLRSELKGRLNSDIDKLVVRKFRATGKRDKKKIQKSITEKKAQLRRLI